MARQSEKEEKSVAEVRKYWEDATHFFGPWHNRMGRELAFTIDQQHYHDDNESDPQRIKPADPALMNMTRHKAAQILKASEHFEMRPIDNRDDPQAAADGKALMERAIYDPESEFQDTMEDVVDGALASGAWACEIGHDPDAGANGELSFGPLDPRRLTWTPGFKSPHGRRCPWICIEKQMLPSEIERMEARGWKNTKGALTDSEARSEGIAGAGSSIPIASPENAPVDAASEQKYTTVLFLYERFVKDMKVGKAYRELEVGDHHMWCPNEMCGFRGMPQSMLTEELPDGPVGDPCPQCGTPTQKVTVEPIEKEVLAYRKGRRLRIVSPIWGKEHYNDAWEFDTRGFPVAIYAPNNHPVNPLPNSDTYYYRSLVCVSDAMLRLGYEQMRKAHGIILAPQDSLYDAHGEPFPFSEHRDVAYYDNDFLAPGAIQWFQPQGLNTAWSTYYQTIQGVFSVNKGTGEIGLTPERSKDIAAQTVRTLVETGEIPVDRNIRRFQRFKSIVLTRGYEILRSVMTTETAVRVLGPNGVYAIRNIRASGLPGYDVIVTAAPTLAQIEMDKYGAIQQLANQPPYMRRFLGRALGIDPRILAEYELEEQEFLSKMKQPATQPPPGTNGGGNAASGYTNRLMEQMQ